MGRTVRAVRQLTEIHHLLPLKLPLAPVDLQGPSSKNARRNERRKSRKGSRSGDDDHTDGASSDSSGWAIATGGASDAELLTSPASRPLSRQASAEPPAFELPPPLAA